ncbi:MAG: hypothetical protein M1838_000434 [Thelocarpon superellum]|nr:MAG: hypothetical protein M1838_000434 [Thelocarpon superellum]
MQVTGSDRDGMSVRLRQRQDDTSSYAVTTKDLAAAVQTAHQGRCLLIVVSFRPPLFAQTIDTPSSAPSSSLNLASSAPVSVPDVLWSFVSSLLSHIPPPIVRLLSNLTSVPRLAYQHLPATARNQISTTVQALPGGWDSPAALGTALLTLLAVLVITMSSWGRGFWSGGGRFSPFGASASAYPPQVNDDDYSYITDDELSAPQPPHEPSRPNVIPERLSEDDDIIRLKVGGSLFPAHFNMYSIDDGLLTVADLKRRAAEIAGVSDARRIRLLYKGRTLNDDRSPCRDEGLKIDSEVLCVVADEPVNGEDEDGSETEGDDSSTGGTTVKRKRKSRRRKTKKSGSNSGSNSSPHLAPPGTGPGRTSRSTSPAPPPTPKTPREKLKEISTHFHSQLLPQSVQFTNNPPTDPAKRDFEHKKLTETILSQVLLKLDAVETEGDAEARQQRKDLVKETQGVLARLDAVR